jgi:mannitol operon transcriptional antiterminator
VALTESRLRGRFTDDAVLQLGLAFAIQAQRVHEGNFLDVEPSELQWLQSNPLWKIAQEITRRIAISPYDKWPESEIASIVMYLLVVGRNERWPDDLQVDISLEGTIWEMIQVLRQTDATANLADDRILYEGLVNQIVPAYYQHRFGIWLPLSLPEFSIDEKYAAEVNLARQMAQVFYTQTQVQLSPENEKSIALLLRAATLRLQTDLQRQILVICPSGMATAQLLVARLKVHFPGLGTYKVISIRDLTMQVANNARFILTTIPLPRAAAGNVPVLQVHPLLLPEDVSAITKLLD